MVGWPDQPGVAANYTYELDETVDEGLTLRSIGGRKTLYQYKPPKRPCSPQHTLKSKQPAVACGVWSMLTGRV